MNADSMTPEEDARLRAGIAAIFEQIGVCPGITADQVTVDPATCSLTLHQTPAKTLAPHLLRQAMEKTAAGCGYPERATLEVTATSDGLRIAYLYKHSFRHAVAAYAKYAETHEQEVRTTNIAPSNAAPERVVVTIGQPEDILAESGLDIALRHFADAGQAVAYVKEHKASVACIITDLADASGTEYGLEIADLAYFDLGRIPTVVIADEISPELVAKIQHAGAYGCERSDDDFKGRLGNFIKLTALLNECGQLHESINRERSAQLMEYRAALKRLTEDEPAMTDIFLERFDRENANFNHYYGNAIYLLTIYMAKGRYQDAYRGTTHYLTACRTLHQAILDHPERMKPGEEEMRQRILDTLPEQIQLVSRIREHLATAYLGQVIPQAQPGSEPNALPGIRTAESGRIDNEPPSAAIGA